LEFEYEKHIRTGSSVQLEIERSADKIIRLNTVVDWPLEDNLFSVYTPISKGMPFFIPVGTEVTVNFLATMNADKVPLSFKANVISVDPLSDSSSTISLEKMSDIYQSQRRDSFRLNTNENIAYRQITKSEADTISEASKRAARKAKNQPLIASSVLDDVERDSARILGGNLDKTMTTNNISATGLKSIIDKKIYANDMIIIELPTKEESLRILSRVLECSPHKDIPNRFDLRLKFETPDDSVKSRIIKHLLNMQSEEIRSQIERGLLDYHTYTDKIPVEHGPEDFTFDAINQITIWSYGLYIILYAILIGSRPRAPWGWEIALGLNVSTTNWNFFWVQNVFYAAIPFVLANVIALKLGYDRFVKYNEEYGEKFRISPVANIIIGIVLILICSNVLSKL
jgi:hypothetical protein